MLAKLRYPERPARWMSVEGCNRYRPMIEDAVAEVTARKVARRQPEKP
jgi:hypothetical protein